MKKVFLSLIFSVISTLVTSCDQETNNNNLSDHTVNIDVVGNYTDTLFIGNTNKPIAVFKFYEVTGGTVIVNNISFTIDGVGADKLSNISLYNKSTETLITNTVTVSTVINGSGGTLSFTGLNLSLIEGSIYTLEIRADILGGTGQSLNIRILNSNDITATDENYLSVIVGPGTNDSSFPIGDNVSRHPIN